MQDVWEVLLVAWAIVAFPMGLFVGDKVVPWVVDRARPKGSRRHGR